MRFIRLLFAAAVALGSTAFVFGGSSPATAAGVFTVPDSIAADCSIDVAGALQAFFASVPDNSNVQLGVGACYRIDTEVKVAGKSGWTLNGRGATLRRFTDSPKALEYPNANAMLRFGNLRNSELFDLHILGKNTVSDQKDLRPKYGAWVARYAFEHGVTLSGAQNVELRDSTIDAVYGDGVYIGGSDASGPARNVRIRNVLVDRNGRQGIAITRADGVVLDGVTIAHSRRSGIDMEPHRGQAVATVEIRNSTINSRLLAITGSGVGQVNNIYVHDNKIIHSAMPVVHDRASGNVHDRRTGWRVVDNEVTFSVRSSGSMLTFGNTDDILVEGNRFALNPGSGLVVRLGRSTATIRCNRFTGAIPKFVVVDAASKINAYANSLTSDMPTCAHGGPVSVPSPATTTNGPTPTTPATAQPPVTRNPTSTPSKTPTPNTTTTQKPSNTSTPTRDTPTQTSTPSVGSTETQPTSPPTKKATRQTPEHLIRGCRPLANVKAVTKCVKAAKVLRACNAVTGRPRACFKATATAVKRCQALREVNAHKCRKAVMKARYLVTAGSASVSSPHTAKMSYGQSPAGRALPSSMSLVALGAIWALCLALTRGILATPIR